MFFVLNRTPAAGTRPVYVSHHAGVVLEGRIAPTITITRTLTLIPTLTVTSITRAVTGSLVPTINSLCIGTSTEMVQVTPVRRTLVSSP